jgi:hypothetical protein
LAYETYVAKKLVIRGPSKRTSCELWVLHFQAKFTCLFYICV